VSPSRSVFDDTSPSARPADTAAPVAPAPTAYDPGQFNQFDSSRSPAGNSAGSSIGATPEVDLALLPTLPKLPTLPPAVPYNPAPAAALADKAPSVADVAAARTAQLRAHKKQNQGRVFKRTVVALLLVGGLIAAALVFGRGYLFPTKWDPALTPVVDAVQLEHGEEFDRTVELVRQPATEYQATVGRLVAGESWVEHVPEWRALGLVTGDPSLASVGAGIASRQLAIYDPEAARIYISDDVDPAAAERDLRLAVEAAFAAQQGEQAPIPASDVAGWVAISGFDALAQRATAFDHVARLPDAPVAPNLDTAALDASSGLPLPIEYELDAVHLLAAGVAEATGLNGEQLVEPLTALLDDAPVSTADVVAPDSTYRPIGESSALGLDDWALVWGVHLPESMVARMTSAVTADAYQVFDREGVACVTGGFDTATAADGSYIASALTNWVNAHPPTAYASVRTVSPTRVELVACDPGADAVVNARPDAVPLLIERQLARA
jgi:hypothetical protein